MTVPENPRIYHIVHVDRLPSIVSDGGLWSDEEVRRRGSPGTAIGMGQVKDRRLRREIASHPGLRVGSCVPFNFCPRSVMLYVIHRANHQHLAYRDGQAPVVHLEADLRDTVAWAERHGFRWAFTLSNAGAGYSEDRRRLDRLHEVDWEAVESDSWQPQKEAKQAEFLVESRFSWRLVERIGVLSEQIAQPVFAALGGADHKPVVEIRRDWYY